MPTHGRLCHICLHLRARRIPETIGIAARLTIQARSPGEPPNVAASQDNIERRLVTACSWLGAVFCAIGVFVNWQLDAEGVMLWGVALSTVIFVAIAVACGRNVPFQPLSVAFLLNVAFLIAGTWDANGGVRGSTTPAIAAAVVFAVLALPGRHAALAIVSPLAIFLILCTLELWDGVPARQPFQGMADAVDSLITTLSTATLCGVGVAMMRRVYERNLDQLQNAATRIEELAAKAVLADREKTRFLARMSHDLRTPLAAVIGSLEVAATEPLRPQIAALLAAARGRCADLERIISDLLDIGMVESGEITLRASTVDLSELAETVIGEARPAKGVELRVTIDPTLPRRVITDATRLRQMLGNLIANACKHTDQGHIELRVAATAERLLFQVVDTGPGIDESDMDRLFQPFSQLPRGMDRGGTGLGLFITRQIATAMSGSLTLSPGPNRGTIARLEIPRDEPGDNFALCAAPPKPVGGRIHRVLLADDEPVIRLVVEAMFGSLDCETTTVEDGAAAVQAALDGNFDAVFLDIQMPVMDGLEAARRIRAARPQQYLVALSANAYPEDQRRAHDAGMNAFLPKPVTIERLSAILERAMLASGQRR